MPAPRNCRACGEALSPDLRRCLACGAAVTEFAVRPPLHDEGFVGAPMHDIHTSRWRASDTTFGPAGRLAITAATIAFLVSGLWMMGFTPMFWPDFTRETRFEAIRDFQKRTRRFRAVGDGD